MSWVRVPPPALDETDAGADNASSPRGAARSRSPLRAPPQRARAREPGGSTRRKLEDNLLDVRERFDRLLDEWIADEELREQWREYIHGRRAEPDEPAGIEPLAFQGLTDAGSVVQVRGRADEYQVWVDGSLQERIAARKDLSVHKPVLHFRWDGKEIAESFNASAAALTALAQYRDDPITSPPWEYASELLADGLIEVHFDLTPRGKRALAGL